MRGFVWKIIFLSLRSRNILPPPFGRRVLIALPTWVFLRKLPTFQNPRACFGDNFVARFARENLSPPSHFFYLFPFRGSDSHTRSPSAIFRDPPKWRWPLPLRGWYFDLLPRPIPQTRFLFEDSDSSKIYRVCLASNHTSTVVFTSPHSLGGSDNPAYWDTRHSVHTQ